MRGIVLLAILSSLAACGVGPICPRVTPSGSNPVAISNDDAPSPARVRAGESNPAYASGTRASSGAPSSGGATPSENEIATPVSAR